MPRSRKPHFGPRDIDPEATDRALELAGRFDVSLDRTDVRDLVGLVGAAAPAVLTPLLASRDLARTLCDEIVARGQILAAQVASAKPAPDEPVDVTKRRLRAMRHEALVRTALRELFAHADVDRTAREWSRVAADCTEHAVAAAENITEARSGMPADERGERVPFVVLGMGKLGGQELNLGSDIDICYFYGTDDGAAGSRTLNEHFGRVGTLVAELLEQATEDGFAFRVDLRLRPEGSRGPMANSLAGAERYYETWGRSWERAALVRARPIAGASSFGDALLDALRPFVYRRSVDPRIAADVAQMLERARHEQLRDDARDLKLGTGAIREAEFFVQSLQLIWGGRHRSLQVQNTLDAIARLRALGLISHRDTQRFGDAWALLRRVEHRIQVMATYETHLIPEDSERQRTVARSLGYSTFDALHAELTRARGTIRRLYESLFPDRVSAVAKTASTPAAPEETIADMVAAASPRHVLADKAASLLGVRDGDLAVEHLQRLARRADLPLGAVARDRFPALGPKLLEEVRDAPDPDRALAFLADLFGSMAGAERYVRRLAESPEQARGLIGLFGASESLSQTLLARPELVDAVVTGGAGAPTSEAIRERVRAATPPRKGAVDAEFIEDAIGALRRVQRETVLQVGLADMAGVLSTGEVARRLSALADASLGEAFTLAAAETMARFGVREGASHPLDGVAVFALGSLAAEELGYGGDIDLIVLFDREGETRGGRQPGVSMAEFVGRIAQRAILFLSTPHAEGPGYAVDTRLRPSGSHGTLVVSLDAFVRYHAHDQTHPGAASWERQALIRSRYSAGDAALGKTAGAAIESVAFERGPGDSEELLRLRDRIEHELGNESRGAIALKFGPGGLVDVEFATQALQMAHGNDRRVRSPATRHAIAALRETGALDPERADVLLNGEKLLRRALMAARLVADRAVLYPGAAATVTVARKLGYRDRAGRTAEEGLLGDIAAERERVRDTFRAIMRDLAARGS